jgi:pyrroloquinoline quinone biosynthesis protein B
VHSVALGAAAGGGFPQWNSNAPACNRARAGDPAALTRSQASLAVSGDGEKWFLLNASPDLREQIGRSEFLHPRAGLRSSPIAGVILTGADIDCITGLLSMRERQPFTIYATRAVHEVLSANPIFEALDRELVVRQNVPLDTTIALDDFLSFSLFAVPGKVPLFLESGAETPPIATGEFAVAVAVSDARHTLYYIPGCAAVTPAVAARVRNAELVYFDGTLWSDDEMIAAGLGAKSGRRMGHMSLSGPDGTIAAFRELGVRRKILIHVNNSNPVLLEDSAEHAAVVAAGWEVAHDGMEIVL